MTVRSLSEAAADILARSQSSADKEPMHKLSGAEVQDLGGSTTENPAGNPVGREAAAKIGQAPKPGPAPKSEGDQASKKISEDEEYDDEDEVLEEEEEMTLDEKRAMIKAAMKEKSCSEDIDAMFSGQDLSEEFKARVEAIFEAAVLERAVMVVEELEAQILEAAEESIEEIKEELEEQMNAYVSYVAGEWLEENRVAVQSGLKAEIMEEFMAGLRDLFVENYMEIPEEQVDVVEAMAEELQEMQEELNNAINANIELMEAINEATKEQVIASVCEGLTATQAEKVKALAEGVEFTTEGEYKEKVEIIKESYFSQQVNTKTVKQSPVEVKEKMAEQTSQYVEASPLMERYVSAISRTNPRT